MLAAALSGGSGGLSGSGGASSGGNLSAKYGDSTGSEINIGSSDETKLIVIGSAVFVGVVVVGVVLWKMAGQ